MADVNVPLIPALGLPPRPPQVSLITSSITPTNEPNVWEFNGEHYELELPSAVQDEIDFWQGEAWTRGFAYWPHKATPGTARSAQDSTTVDTVSLTSNPKIVTVQPWLVTSQESASSFAFQAENLEGRVKTHVDNTTPYIVENEFWTGALATAKGWGNNFLTNAASALDVTPTPGTAVSVTEGLSLLQEALSQNATKTSFGGQGMIHMMPRIVPNLLTVRRINRLLLDNMDNVIVPGSGYTGSGPGNVAPTAGQTWMYATDLVYTRVARDIKVYPQSVSQALDRSEGGNPNTITYRGERQVCAYFDGHRHFAVLVTIP